MLAPSADRRYDPVESLMWLLFAAENRDIQKQWLLASFVERVLTSEQRESSALGYVPLPVNVIRIGQCILKTLH